MNGVSSVSVTVSGYIRRAEMYAVWCEFRGRACLVAAILPQAFCDSDEAGREDAARHYLTGTRLTENYGKPFLLSIAETGDLTVSCGCGAWTGTAEEHRDSSRQVCTLARELCHYVRLSDRQVATGVGLELERCAESLIGPGEKTFDGWDEHCRSAVGGDDSRFALLSGKDGGWYSHCAD